MLLSSAEILLKPLRQTVLQYGRPKCIGWLVGFVALRPKSTAMVIAGWSVHLTTLFPGQA